MRRCGIFEEVAIAAICLAAIVSSACKSERSKDPAPVANSESAETASPTATAKPKGAAVVPVKEPRNPADAGALPRSVSELEQAAELVCTCTTPSCIERFVAQVERAKSAIEPSVRASHRALIEDLGERVADCAKVASADGLDEADDDETTEQVGP